MAGLAGALEQGQTSWRSVNGPPLFPRDTADNRQGLMRIRRAVGALMGQTRPLVAPLAHRSDRGIQSARSRLMAMHEVIKPLMGQMVQGIATGKVAAHKSGQVGMPQARAMVRNKAGTKTEFGLASLRGRLGGGALCGTRIAANADERQMPLQALAASRTIFGQEATPARVVDDRGGDATATRERLASAGVQEGGRQPTGKRPWSVAEGVRDQMRRERGRTEGSMGTVKSPRDKCNKPKERLWPTLEMSGPRSLLSFNLHKCMRDVVALVS
jgi:hypothetical protein